MFEKMSEIYLADLAEHLSQSWSKLKIGIGWCNVRGEPRNIALSESKDIRRSLLYSIKENRPVTFDTPEEKGIAVPVYVHGQCVGCIICLLPENLAGQSEGLYGVFCEHVEQFHANWQKENELASLSQALAGSYEELSLIYKLGEHFQITDDPQTFFLQFADDLLDLMDAHGLIFLIDHRFHGRETCIRKGNLTVTGEDAGAVGRYLLGLSDSSQEPMIFSDISAHPTLVRILKVSTLRLLACPIQANGKTLGILIAVRAGSSDDFTSSDAKLLGSVAGHAASFLQNRFLLADMQELLTGLLTSLVNAIDAKDPYTRGHSQRVAFIGQQVAEAMGLSKTQCAEIYMAGLFHDIGKIGIDDRVLGKPGKLTDEEFATVQQHPVIGSRIISSVRQLRNVLPGVLHHHERYDGKGYCEGLVGDQIPLMGTIVGLADCFDAITSHRTYRSAMSFQQAIEEVQQCSGTQFSPIVVRALLDSDLEKLERDLVALSDQSRHMQMLPCIPWFESFSSTS